MNKGFAGKDILLLVVVIAAFSAFAFPRYFWESEKARAAAMDSILAGAELAQDAFYRTWGRFSSDWAELAGLYSVPHVLGVTSRPVEGTPAELYFAFIGPNGKPESDGYIMRLEPAGDPEEASFISARRVGGRYDYTLRRELPFGATNCLAQEPRSVRFCERFTRYMEPLSFVPAQNTPREEAAPLP